MEQVKPGIMITNGYSGCLRIWGREGDIDGEEKQRSFLWYWNVLYLIWMVGT